MLIKETFYALNFLLLSTNFGILNALIFLRLTIEIDDNQIITLIALHIIALIALHIIALIALHIIALNSIDSIAYHCIKAWLPFTNNAA